ncbi:MAG: alkaline phosphatase family protein [Pirellulales bacterium]
MANLVRFSVRLLFLACSLCFAFCQTATAEIERVVMISVDGLRGDLLANLVHGSPATYPNFTRLEAQGASTYNARTDYTHTETIPDHLSMITSRPVSQPVGQPATVQHGYENNFPGANDTLHNAGNPAVDYIASVFDVVHDHGLGTALYVGKTRMEIMWRSYNAANGGPDTIGADNGRNKIDASLVTNGNGATITTAYLAAATATPPHYSFVHLVDPDTVGHSTGWGTAAWNTSVAAVDTQLGRILSFIDTNPSFAGKTALLLTGDHGGLPTRTHDDATNPANYTVPYFIWGPGIAAGVDIHSIFWNRFDPGSTRPDYNALRQPVRNVDSANLALALLGLPPVPGSSVLPQLCLASGCPPGDANGDGVVDRQDLAILAENYGTTSGATVTTGDFNGDGRTDLADLAMQKSNYGLRDFSPAALAPAVAHVPESDSLALAVAMLLVGYVFGVAGRKGVPRRRLAGCFF